MAKAEKKLIVPVLFRGMKFTDMSSDARLMLAATNSVPFRRLDDDLNDIRNLCIAIETQLNIPKLTDAESTALTTLRQLRKNLKT
jgi:hypothetical protein